MKPHIFHPDAGEEYARAVEYYADITPEFGSRFHDEIVESGPLPITILRQRILKAFDPNPL